MRIKRELRLVASLVTITVLVIRSLLFYRRRRGGAINKPTQELIRHLVAPVQERAGGPRRSVDLRG
jgi:hypothetical protein